MGAKGEIYRLAPEDDDEEELARPTQVRAMPPKILALLKQTQDADADERTIDSELADAADLADLIVNHSTPPPASGVVPRVDPEDLDPEPVALSTARGAEQGPLPLPARTPHFDVDAVLGRLKQPYLPTLEALSGNVGFAIALLTLAVAYAVLMRLLHLW